MGLSSRLGAKCLGTRVQCQLAAFAIAVGIVVFTVDTQAAERHDPGVRVETYRVERDVHPGRNRVVGTLTNVGSDSVRKARVTFKLFDANWHIVGRAVDEVHDLEPGQTWKFHALARGNVSRARLLRVDAE
ncbi:FxLYD domain-containing protein [Dyella solisilvae]|uniref:FxLYD domain-containing protein n=1 Tax=Dyella solisilvae TaxID=1920168 RepID=UPI003CCCE0D9